MIPHEKENKRLNCEVLMVDDESPFRLKSKILFLRAGWKSKFTAVKTSTELLNLYKSLTPENISTIFCDYNLVNDPQGLNGVDIGHEINFNLGNNVKMFIISTSDGYSLYNGKLEKFKGLTELEAAKLAGFNGWINKSQNNLEVNLRKVNEKIKKNDNNFIHLI